MYLRNAWYQAGWSYELQEGDLLPGVCWMSRWFCSGTKQARPARSMICARTGALRCRGGDWNRIGSSAAIMALPSAATVRAKPPRTGARQHERAKLPRG